MDNKPAPPNRDSGYTPPPQPAAPDQSGQKQAAEVARAQVQQVYDRSEQASDNPYNRTHQENFDWRQYHSAWQQYYQRYYEQYYMQQLQSDRQKLVGQKALHIQGTAQQTVTGADPAANQPSKTAELKERVIETVKDRAGQIRKSHHFVPIASAIGVVLLILFLQFNNLLLAQVHAYVSPGAVSNESIIVDPTKEVAVGPEPKLIIPKINVDVPIDFGVTTLDEGKIQRSLRDGVTHYNLPGANAVPGRNGNSVLLGHSSNDVFNQGEYKFVFVLLDRLQPGDTFYVHYKGKRYIYEVTESRVIDPTDIAALQRGNSKPMVTLVTCTPPGTDLQRLVVFADQISPEPGKRKETAPPKPAKPTDARLPGVESNWLDNLWNSLF